MTYINVLRNEGILLKIDKRYSIYIFAILDRLTNR